MGHVGPTSPEWVLERTYGERVLLCARGTRTMPPMLRAPAFMLRPAATVVGYNVFMSR